MYPPSPFSGCFRSLFTCSASSSVSMVTAGTSAPSSSACWWSRGLVAATAVIGLAGYVGFELKKARGEYRLAVRNFYGGLRVSDSGKGRSATRTLTHGTINHGDQYLDPSQRRMPTTYYGPHHG